MSNAKAGQADNQPQLPASRKVYERPKLHIYGKVHHLTQGTQNNGNDGGGLQTKNSSDRSLKEHIIQIDKHPLGIGLYLFAYKSEFRDALGHGRHFGVMADEVEIVMPDAVSLHPDGYKVVDYALLGISPTRH